MRNKQSESKENLTEKLGKDGGLITSSSQIDSRLEGKNEKENGSTLNTQIQFRKTVLSQKIPKKI